MTAQQRKKEKKKRRKNAAESELEKPSPKSKKEKEAVGASVDDVPVDGEAAGGDEATTDEKSGGFHQEVYEQLKKLQEQMNVCTLYFELIHSTVTSISHYLFCFLRTSN